MVPADPSFEAPHPVISGLLSLSPAASSLCPPQIVAWDEPDFQGRKQEFTSECYDMAACSIEHVRSARVESGT